MGKNGTNDKRAVNAALKPLPEAEANMAAATRRPPPKAAPIPAGGPAALLPGMEAHAAHNSVKFEVFGQEMLEKRVKPSGNSGRVYLPPDWVGSRVKVIRLE
jgi:hypothetical protein